MIESKHEITLARVAGVVLIALLGWIAVTTQKLDTRMMRVETIVEERLPKDIPTRTEFRDVDRRVRALEDEEHAK